MRRLLLTTALLLPLPAMADDVALVLGAERYERLSRVARADDVLEATGRLQALGFEVFSRANPRAGAANDLAAAFQSGAAEADRLVIALSGHFVTDGTRSWLLTAEADTPDLFSVQDQGLSLDGLLVVLAQRPGKAVLVLGAADPRELDLDDSGLQAGVADTALPQGVTLIQTSPGAAATLLAGDLTEPDASIGTRLTNNTALNISGYLPRNWRLMPGDVVDTPPAPQVGPTPADLNAEATLWDRTTAADDVDSYRTYIRRYPEGRFVDDAEAQIAAILAEPNRNARLTEELLRLSRDNRRAIQTNLTLLTYNTRGVDGIFGSGTRGAIMNWQQSNGFPQTSYVTREQINLLDAQAARRRAEIAADETREQAQAEARDRSYWGETGGLGDEPGYRAYLERYPDGLFANIAKARLADIEERRGEAAQGADRAAWTRAQAADSVSAYQEYLAAYPSGVFASQASARIAALDGPRVTDAQIAQARDEESALRLSGVRAQLLELSLREQGFDPGRMDGVIDDDTRDAITAYQNSKNLTPTGYVDRATALGLMTGSLQFSIER